MYYVISAMVTAFVAVAQLYLAKSGVAFIGVLMGALLLIASLFLLYRSSIITATVLSTVLLLGQLALYGYCSYTYPSLAPTTVGMTVCAGVQLMLLFKELPSLWLSAE